MPCNSTASSQAAASFRPVAAKVREKCNSQNHRKVAGCIINAT
jgi:hypothetical protein